MIEKQITQGTSVWLAWRRGMVMASDISSILGLNPWKSEHETWLEKAGLASEVFMTDKMKEGVRLEPIAREYYERLKGESFQPIVAEHDEISYLGASLDGISLDRKHALEIKCGAGSYKMAEQGVIPDYYMCQCQQIYLVTGCESLDYFAWREKSNDGIIIAVKRDQDMIDRIVREAHRFHECMVNFISPNAIERKYEVVDE